MTRLTALVLPAALALAPALLPALASPALAATAITTGETAMGKVLTDGDGMTLYVFDKDSGTASACYNACASNWPPLLAPKGATAQGDFGLIERTDGAMQWTYHGKPLYLWAKDDKPGDTTGDGVNGVWHAARPMN